MRGMLTLPAWAFACLGVVVQALDPHGFSPLGEGTRTWMDLLSLSFTVPSSIGLCCAAMVVARLGALRGSPAARDDVVAWGGRT